MTCYSQSELQHYYITMQSRGIKENGETVSYVIKCIGSKIIRERNKNMEQKKENQKMKQKSSSHGGGDVTGQAADPDVRYMKEAMKQAMKAYALGEVPIGCIIVYEGKIIGRGYNRRNTDKNTLAHAEITAIKKASKSIGDWRLEETTLYVTLEPCQMCAGAIVQARIPRVVIGCMNPKAGCAGSILNILEMPEFNHQVEVSRGVLEEQCSNMLKKFFQELRERNKIDKQRIKEEKQKE